MTNTPGDNPGPNMRYCPKCDSPRLVWIVSMRGSSSDAKAVATCAVCGHKQEV